MVCFYVVQHIYLQYNYSIIIYKIVLANEEYHVKLMVILRFFVFRLLIFRLSKKVEL